MNIQLIEGQFSANESIAIISEMIQVKIRFHESKIKSTHGEEDIKMREKKIKHLQNELAKVRTYISGKENPIAITSQINL